MTDHDRRVNALAAAVNCMTAMSEAFNDQRFAVHAGYLADILADYRAMTPDTAAELAREWARERLGELRAMGDAA